MWFGLRQIAGADLQGPGGLELRCTDPAAVVADTGQRTDRYVTMGGVRCNLVKSAP